MKHLKSFENLNIDDIKKYIVWIGIHTEILIFDKHETYSLESGLQIRAFDYLLYRKGQFIPNSSEKSSYIGEKDIKFTSDNLEDCKEYIETLYNTNKYNL